MKKQIALWSLYDFANSLAIGVFTLYFSQWMVIDKGVTDIWYNLIYVGSTILLVLSAPVFGTMADKKGIKKTYLVITTVLQMVFLIATSILAVAFPDHRPVILAAGITFTLANYFYQFTFTFYNAMLPDIAPPRLQGLVSGIGQFGNFTGYITGLIVSLPLVTGSLYWFGNPGRAQAFLPAVILFAVFSLPVLLFLKDSGVARQVTISLKEEYKNYMRSFLELVRLPSMGRFLLAFFFFNDAVLTTTNNFSIYLEQVFHTPDKIKSLIGVAVFGLASVGALAGGWLSDKVGLKKVLIVVLVLWILVLPTMGLLKNFAVFTAFCILVGLLYGATWAVTRAIMVKLSPSQKINHAFSYYNLFERFSTLIGPIAWGLITTLLISHGPIRYRYAMASMAIFVLIGLFIVRKVKIPKTSV